MDHPLALPEPNAIDPTALGLLLARLERRWHTASLSVLAGVEPPGIDDLTLTWWRGAYAIYIGDSRLAG